MVWMTEAVNTVERHIILLAELFQPAVRGLIVHGFAVPLDKESVTLYPLVAQAECFLVLLVFQLIAQTVKLVFFLFFLGCLFLRLLFGSLFIRCRLCLYLFDFTFGVSHFFLDRCG